MQMSHYHNSDELMNMWYILLRAADVLFEINDILGSDCDGNTGLIYKGVLYTNDVAAVAGCLQVYAFELQKNIVEER